MKRIFILLAIAALHIASAAASAQSAKPDEGMDAPFTDASPQAPATAETAESRALILRRKTVYARYMYALFSRDLTLGVYRLAETQGSLARERYAEGLASRKEMMRAQESAARLRSELVKQTAAARRLHGEFNAAAGRPDGTPVVRRMWWRVVPEKTELEYMWLSGSLVGASPDFFAQDAKARRAGLVRQVAGSGRYPKLDSGTRFSEAITELIDTPLLAGPAARLLDGAPWWWRTRDTSRSAKLADLVEHLAALSSTGPARIDEQKLQATRAGNNFDAALSRHDTGRKDFGELLAAQMRMRQARQAALKLHLDRQVHLAEIEYLLGEKL